MRIAIIGCQRSRSTALHQFVMEQNPNLKDQWNFYSNLYVHQNDELKRRVDKKYSEYLQKKLLSFHDLLYTEMDNYIIKLQGTNFDYKFDHAAYIGIEKFDKLYLIERHDFFEGSCSLQIAREENVWFDVDAPKTSNLHAVGKYFRDVYDKKISKSNYTIHPQTIINHALDIRNYLKMKKFIIENKLEHQLFEYNDNIFQSGRQIGYIRKVNLDYSSKITNYHIKSQVNEIFNRYYNFDTCNSDITNFKTEISNLVF
jgi:hypothetical protein